MDPQSLSRCELMTAFSTRREHAGHGILLPRSVAASGRSDFFLKNLRMDGAADADDDIVDDSLSGFRSHGSRTFF